MHCVQLAHESPEFPSLPSRGHLFKRSTGFNKSPAQLMRSLVILVAVATQGCSTANCLQSQHQSLCRRDMQIIVHNTRLWQEYKALSELAYQKRAAEYLAYKIDVEKKMVNPKTSTLPSIAQRLPSEPVEGYVELYGEGRTRHRPSSDNRITKNDIYIVKDGEEVVQLVDYIVSLTSLDGSTPYTCYGMYPPVYLQKTQIYLRKKPN
jgi:hypothetical protein